MQNYIQKIENICIIKTSSLGDICHMMPFIHTLRSKFPKAKITWIIGSQEKKLVENFKDINFIIFNKSKTFKSYIEVYRNIKKIKFDVLFLMQVSTRTNVMASFISSSIKIGFDKDKSSELHSFFINRTIKPIRDNHMVDTLLSFLDVIGLEKSDYIYNWDLQQKVDSKKILDKFSIDKNNYFLINACSRDKNRNWSVENYANVADYIINKYSLCCFFIGSNSEYDKNYFHLIKSKMKRKSFNLVGKTSINELIPIIKYARFIISPDSGPIHLATSVDTPVVGLYGVTNTRRAGPYNSKEYCIDMYDDALVKFSNIKKENAKWRYKNKHKDTMSLIKVDDVIKKIDSVLELGKIN